MTKHNVIIPSNSANYHSAEPADGIRRRSTSNFARALKRSRAGRKRLFRVVPPAPRLVGVEPNPGPPKRTSRRAASASAPPPRKAGRRRRPAAAMMAFQPPGLVSWKAQPRSFRNAPNLQSYMAALMNPFNASPPKLGFNTFVATIKRTAFYEAPTVGLLGTSLDFAVVVNPSLNTNSIAFYGTALGPGTTLVASLDATTSAFSNAATLAAQVQQGRIIAAELRVKARYGANSVPGTMGGIYCPDETRTNIVSRTYTALQSLQKYVPFSCTAAGALGGAVQYRPLDSNSYEFSGQVVDGSNPIPGASGLPHLIVVGTGWTSGFKLECSIVMHVECTTGVESAGEVDDEPSLVAGGVAFDQAANAVVSISPTSVVPSISAIEMLDAGIANAVSSSYMTGMSGRLGSNRPGR